MLNGVTIPAAYDGREQALIKHVLLKGYLEKLFHIIGMNKSAGKTELCYVDCFAGPWGDASGGMESTSIAISLSVLASCKRTLEKRGINATIRALYIEQDTTAFGRLKKYVESDTPEGIVTSALPGDFVTLREDIVRWVGPDAFTFFFIDPKGWKDVGVAVLRPLLQRPKSEFLINFMYDFVNRTMSMENWQDEMSALLGEAITLDGLDPGLREAKILATYRKNLKDCFPAASNLKFRARAAHVRVMNPTKERPKYHLVYLTSHPKGVVEFMETSEHVDLIQKRVRAQKQVSARERRSGMADLFGPESHVDESAGHASALDVDRFWIEHLDRGARLVATAEFADMLETTGWFPSDLQASLNRLTAAKQVVNLDSSSRRPKRPLHFEGKGERLALPKHAPPN
jgi:three-Cys-motif partner protein